MSTTELRLTTREQRERLYEAQQHGGLCVACGRTLDTGDAVYIVSVPMDMKDSGGRLRRRTVRRDTPLGTECVAPALLAWMDTLTEELCEGCGRPVRYQVNRMARNRVLCSKRCGHRVSQAAMGKGVSR